MIQVSSSVYDRTYSSLRDLYLNSIEMQGIALGSFSYYEKDVLAYLKDICTVRLSCSRRSGHTTAFSLLVKEFNLNGVIVLMNYNQVRMFKESHYKGNDDVILLYEGQLLNREYDLGEGKHDFICLDSASLMRRSESRVYELARELYISGSHFVVFFIQ